MRRPLIALVIVLLGTHAASAEILSLQCICTNPSAKFYNAKGQESTSPWSLYEDFKIDLGNSTSPGYRKVTVKPESIELEHNWGRTLMSDTIVIDRITGKATIETVGEEGMHTTWTGNCKKVAATPELRDLLEPKPEPKF